MHATLVYAEDRNDWHQQFDILDKGSDRHGCRHAEFYNASLTTMNANFMLTKGSAGYFAISGYNLVTSNVIPPGNYSVRVNAVGTKTWWDDQANFVITVTA